MSQSLRVAGALMLLGSVPQIALAGKCQSDGALLFVGKLNAREESVWLSRNQLASSDVYRLDAAKNSSPSFSETFDIAGNGLHLSFSPVVSNGSGGTHKLYGVSSGSDCLLDTQNQKNGITFPPIGGGNGGGGGGTGGGTDCSGLMKPDTHLGENARQIEVSDDQATPYLFR
jgi:hypothetical protein